MFGPSLLVAPVFKESGEVSYYLPKGTWINLITGEKKEGGTWIKETHDYHSLPLMVRENTILPMGASEKQNMIMPMVLHLYFLNFQMEQVQKYKFRIQKEIQL